MATKPGGAKWRRMVRDQWSEAAAAWERWEGTNLHFLSPVVPVMARALDLKPGHRVLDFGCGTGEPALQFARWVEPRGRVTGLDVAGPMVEVARRRARLLGIRNATFRRGDIETLPGRAKFDRISARFGIMFVDDVPRALAAIRAALRPGGRTALAVWGEMERNPSLGLTSGAIRPYLKVPAPDPETSPSPFRFHRRGRLERLMRQAGLRDVRTVEVPVAAVYPDADQYVVQMIVIAAPMRAAYKTLRPADQRRVRERLRRAALCFRSGSAIRIPGLARVVSARR